MSPALRAAILACVLIALGAGGYVLGRDRLAQDEARLAEIENGIAVMERQLVEREEILAELRVLSSLGTGNAYLVDAPTAAIAAAQVQGFVSRIVEKSGGIVVSSGNLQAEPLGAFAEIGVAMDLQVSNAGLREILLDLEHWVPVTLVSAIDIRADNNASDWLTVRLEVRAYTLGAASG